MHSHLIPEPDEVHFSFHRELGPTQYNTIGWMGTRSFTLHRPYGYEYCVLLQSLLMNSTVGLLTASYHMHDTRQSDYFQLAIIV